MSNPAEMVNRLSHEAVLRAFAEQSLFENKTWRYSPEAFALSAKQVAEIELIGQACYDFYRAHETLYIRSATDKNLLRNRELKAPWVAEYLDRGKPQALIEHARSKALRGRTPMVVRPDLLVTEDGFALTEIDSVPGGIGLTAFLNRLYSGVHGDALIGTGSQDMIEAFYQALSSRAPDRAAPMIAILVSDEAATYRPEMEWIAQELRALGRKVYVYHTDDVMPLGGTMCVPMDGEPQQVDVIYRFWELFDLANVSGRRLPIAGAQRIAVKSDSTDAAISGGEAQLSIVSPPYVGGFLAGDVTQSVLSSAETSDSADLDYGSSGTAAQRGARCTFNCGQADDAVDATCGCEQERA